MKDSKKWEIRKCLFSIQCNDDRVLYYLLVDSLNPIEILVSFSALVRWDIGGKANAEKCMLMFNMFMKLSLVMEYFDIG